MPPLHLVLYLLAIVFLCLAAFPTLMGPRPVQWQWLAAACLVLTWIV